MANIIFYEQARQQSYEVRNPPNYSDKMYTENPLILQQILNNLTNFILIGWQDKVDLASLSGRNFTAIYRYFRTDMFQDYPIYILINGPEDNPNFFKNYGYTSVMQQINTQLAPGKAVNNFSTANKGSQIVLSW